MTDVEWPYWELWCKRCLHHRNEHDQMDDCHRQDKRTRTGLCKCPGWVPV